MSLFLADDARARDWSPFAETRPVGELRFGALRLRERVERWSGLPCWGHRVGALSGAPWPAGLDEPGVPPVLRGEVPLESDIFLWLSRAAPSLDAPRPELPPDEVRVFAVGGIVAGLWIPAGTVPDVRGRAPLGEAPAPEQETVDVPGWILEWPWNLVEANAEALSRDLAVLHPGEGADAPPGTHRVGNAPVSLGAGVSVGPGVILDTRGGPIRLDDGVTVEGPARLSGPLHLGPGCRVLGGHLSRVSAGPGCRLRGEVDTTVILGFCNKAHDGYLGHALLGQWVNLGALTTNSDLKNDYGTVRVDLPAGTVDTGLIKVGTFLGDHVKTGIGTLLNTGSVVGAGSNVFGGGLAPKSIGPFSWAGNGSVTPYRWEKFLQVARIVAGRRDQPWTPGTETVLRRLWEATHDRTS